MRGKKREVLQAEEITYFYTAFMKEGFIDHFKGEKIRCVRLQVIVYFFIVTDCHNSKRTN